jgi:hypothetical protein
MTEFYYYAFSDKFKRYSKVNITMKSMVPIISFVVLIIIPIIEICITDVNHTELECTSSMNITVIDWSVSKNIFILMLSFLISTYLLTSKYSNMRFFMRLSIFIADIFIAIWLIIGMVLIYRDCYSVIPSSMAWFNFFNILFGMASVMLSIYIVYDSFNRDEIPLLDATRI